MRVEVRALLPADVVTIEREYPEVMHGDAEVAGAQLLVLEDNVLSVSVGARA